MSIANATGSPVHLFGEIALAPHFFDEVELALEPIDAVLFVLQDPLEELASAIVGLVAADGDGTVQPLLRVDLELEIDLVLLHRILAHPDRAEPLHLGNAAEEEDPTD